MKGPREHVGISLRRVYKIDIGGRWREATGYKTGWERKQGRESGIESGGRRVLGDRQKLLEELLWDD